MAISNFIPEVWAAALLERFNTANVIIPTLNRSYEGDLRRGNQVHITAITTPNVQDYSGSRSVTIDALSDTTIPLSISYEDAIAFKVDDVDRVQSAGSFEPVTRDAGAALSESAEAAVIAEMLDNGTASDVTGVAGSFEDAYEVVNSMRKELALANVPTSSRYLAVSPEFASLLLAADGQLAKVNEAGAAGELRNGVLGNLLGFTVIEHPQLTNDGDPAAIAYHGPSVAFVGQLEKVETGRMENAFADYVRALSVYGTRVLREAAVRTYLPS